MMIETLKRIALGSSTLESHTAKFQEDYKRVEGVIKCWEIIKGIDKTSLLHFIAVCVKDQEKYQLLKEALL